MERIDATTALDANKPRATNPNPNSSPTKSSSPRWSDSTPSATGARQSPAEHVSAPKTGCAICAGVGWLYAGGPDDPNAWEPGPYGMQTKLVRCSCKDGDNRERQHRYLESIDGLTPTERGLTFDGLVEGHSNTQLAANIREGIRRQRGILTLTGKPGTGKTTMLICAVNEAKAANIQAVYAPMADLLDYLRKAYSPESRISADKRWDLLTGVDVLAIDELDQFNTTPWAMEKFLHLIDIRWRNLDRRMTLCATNVPLSQLPEKVESRLRDGRALVHETGGPDMRKFASW